MKYTIALRAAFLDGPDDVRIVKTKGAGDACSVAYAPKQRWFNAGIVATLPYAARCSS